MSDSRPALLMIAERFPPDLGGVARSASRTAAVIARLGWDVHVLAWTKSLAPGELASEEIELAEGGGGRLTLHRLGLFSNWDFSMQHTSNVLEWLHAQIGFAAVWGHYVYPAGYMAVVFAETCGLPATVSARGNDIDRLMFPPGDFARLMWTLGRAKVVSCVSRDLENKTAMLLGKPVDTVVVPNVVDTEVFCPSTKAGGSALRQSLGIEPGEVVLGFCGELRHKKGLPFILAALQELRQQRSACLLVIGEVRPREQAHLATFAGEFPDAAKRIIVTGHLEQPTEVARHLQLCDVVLQPSVWDGLPNAVLEAMACGSIVLASDAGGIPEVIDHGVNGFVIPKSQLHRLGEAIGEVLDLDSATRDAMSRAARQRVEEGFHGQLEVARLDELLKRLTATREE